MNLAHWLERTAARTPHAPALLHGTLLVADYRTFAARAASLAAGLAGQYGVSPGDRVALFCPNAPDYLVSLYGIWWAGAVAVPVNYKLHPKEASFIIADCGAKLVLTSEREDLGAPALDPKGADFAALLAGEAIGPPCARAGEDVLWLFYTSGTTGRPKGVQLTSLNLQAMTFAYFVDVDDVLASDAALYAAPLSHGAGLYNFMHVLRGSRHVVPASGGFDPAEIAALAPALKDVSMFAAPTMVRRLVQHGRQAGYRGEGIRTIVYGGGPMYVADIEDAVEWFGPRFVQIYGQGESPMTITALPRAMVADRSHRRWQERLASVGMAQSCVEVRILDEDGAPTAPGTPGEVAVRGPSVMPGYWNNTEATARTLKDGWLHTGDVGVLDGDGFLTLMDRSKDLIISGGTNIYPREVEEALLTHPSVAEAAVVGRPHADWGEEVVAFIVPGAGTANESDLDAHCRSLIAAFKRPRAYRFVSDLPKNAYGKILKTALRKSVAGSGTDADRSNF